MFLKITSGIFRGSWWIFLLLLFLVAAYLSLGRIVAYSVASNQEQIKEYLRRSGLGQVEVGTIRGDWQIHDPFFELRDVALAPGGKPVLSVDRINVRLNSIQSLLRRGPVISTIELSGLRFALERDDRGIKIRGLPRGGEQFQTRYILDSVEHLQSLSVTGIEIEFIDELISLTFESVTGDPWLVRESDGVRQVSLPFLITRRAGDDLVRQREVRMTGSYRGDPRRQDFVAELYLNLPNISLSDYLPNLSFGDQRLAAATLDTEAWFQISPAEVDARGKIRLTDLRVTGQKGEVQLIEESLAQLRFHGESFSSGRLHIPRLTVRHGDAQLDVESLSLAIDDRLGRPWLAGWLPTLSVEDLMSLLHAIGRSGLVAERLYRAMAAVDPRGKLNDIVFSAGLDGADLKLVGELEEFSMGAYLGVPAISRLDGLVSLEPHRGYIDIDNDNFEMHFKNMFPESWPFDSGRGRISYEVGESAVQVRSGLVELIRGDLEAYGKVSLNLPPARDQQTWGLAVGIRQADLLEGNRYLPDTVSDDLTAWLDASIRAGVSSVSGLNVHGALSREAPPIRKSYDVFLEIEDAELQYHPDWPQVKAVAATVHVNNYEVKSGNVRGRVLSSDITVARVHAPVNEERQIDTVLVDAVATGPFYDGLIALKSTPLAATTSNMAAQWSGDGKLSTMISLNVPIGERADEEVFANVRLEFNESTLIMPDFDLRVENLAGSATYRSDTGLSSNGFGGSVFGRDMAGSIKTEIKGEGGEIIVALDGAVAAEDLYRWADQVLLSRLDGTLTYRTLIHVPFGGVEDRSYIVARADLEGVRVNLPYPLAKERADDRRNFEYRQYFLEDHDRVELAFADKVTASLKIQDGMATGGRIHLGSDAVGIVTYDALRMSGHLDFLDAEAWLDTIEELGQLSDVALESAAARYVESAQLTFDELLVFSLPLIDVTAKVTREQGAWLANLQNAMLAGDVRVYDDDSLPVRIDLERASFASDENDADPLADVDPTGIEPIDFSVAHLVLDDKDYGAWSFQFRSDDRSARFENLAARAAGVEVLPGAGVEWTAGEDGFRSRFEGSLVIANLSDALTTFGFASSVEGSDLNLSAKIAWPGSPAMVDVDTMTGTVDIRNGQGRFVQAETGGALKLLGIFDFASLARRFRLDFSDVINEGFEFQDIKGVTSFDQGLISVQEPILIKGSSGSFKVGGTVNLNSRELDNDMIVTLPVSRTLPWYAAYSAIATGPLAGAGVLLAQRVFENQINQMSSAKYRVSGTIEQPFIEFVSIFNDSVREAGAGSD